MNIVCVCFTAGMKALWGVKLWQFLHFLHFSPTLTRQYASFLRTKHHPSQHIIIILHHGFIYLTRFSWWSDSFFISTIHNFCCCSVVSLFVFLANTRFYLNANIAPNEKKMNTFWMSLSCALYTIAQKIWMEILRKHFHTAGRWNRTMSDSHRQSTNTISNRGIIKSQTSNHCLPPLPWNWLGNPSQTFERWCAFSHLEDCLHSKSGFADTYWVIKMWTTLLHKRAKCSLPSSRLWCVVRDSRISYS